MSALSSLEGMCCYGLQILTGDHTFCRVDVFINLWRGDNCICQSRLITTAALTTVTFTLSTLLNQLAPWSAHCDSCSLHVTSFLLALRLAYTFEEFE